jgi:sulfur carrier protein
VTITVNGRREQIAEGTTILALLERLAIPNEAVAVAIGREVVPRREHANRRIAEGDEIEIVRAVGGG